MPACTSAGVLGMARTISGMAAQPAREIGSADAGGDGDHQLAVEQRCRCVRDFAHLLRLDRQHDASSGGNGRCADSAVGRTPNSRCSRARPSAADFHHADSACAVKPFCSRPPISAPAMLPPPMKVMFMMLV